MSGCTIGSDDRQARHDGGSTSVTPTNSVDCPTCSAAAGTACCGGNSCEERVALAELPFPIPRPKDTGFGPLDSDNFREWDRWRRDWEAGKRWDVTDYL